MRVSKSEVGKKNFALIETELKNYHASKKRLKDLEDSILYASSSGGGEVRGSGISDSTSSKAIKLASNLFMIEISRRLEAIEYAIEVFKSTGNPKKLEFIKLKYFESKYNNFGIMMKLGIENGQFYRWRNELVELIANRLGWDVE